MHKMTTFALALALFTTAADAAVRCPGTSRQSLSVASGQRFDLPVAAVPGTLDYYVQRTASWQLLPSEPWLITGQALLSTARPAPDAPPVVSDTIWNADPQLTQSLYYTVTATDAFDPGFQPCTQDFLVSVSLDPLLARDATRIVIPVAGSLSGANNSVFRTRVVLENVTDTTITGSIVFRPSSGSASSSVAYSLPPKSVKQYDDVVLATGGSGLGSLDVAPDRTPYGFLAPRVTAQLDSLAASGAFGTDVPAVAMGDREFGAVWTAPENPRLHIGDTATKRFNIGLRTLADEVRLTAILTSASGQQKAMIERTLPPDSHQQTSVASFFGATIATGDVIELIASRKSGPVGGVIAYLATTDNSTNDVQLEVPRPAQLALPTPLVACSNGVGCRLLDFR